MKNLVMKLAVEYKTHMAVAVVLLAGAAFAFGFWFHGHGPPPKCGPTNQDLAVCTERILAKLGAPKPELISCAPIETPGEYRCVVTPSGTNDNACYSLIVKRGQRGFPIPVKLEANGTC